MNVHMYRLGIGKNIHHYILLMIHSDLSFNNPTGNTVHVPYSGKFSMELIFETFENPRTLSKIKIPTICFIHWYRYVLEGHCY